MPKKVMKRVRNRIEGRQLSDFGLQHRGNIQRLRWI